MKRLLFGECTGGNSPINGPSKNSSTFAFLGGRDIPNPLSRLWGSKLSVSTCANLASVAGSAAKVCPISSVVGIFDKTT
jgi:hypothetical protein